MAESVLRIAQEHDEEERLGGVGAVLVRVVAGKIGEARLDANKDGTRGDGQGGCLCGPLRRGSDLVLLDALVHAHPRQPERSGEALDCIQIAWLVRTGRLLGLGRGLGLRLVDNELLLGAVGVHLLHDLGERLVGYVRDAIVADHVVAERDLDDLVRGNGRCHRIHDVGPPALAHLGHLLSCCAREHQVCVST